MDFNLGKRIRLIRKKKGIMIEDLADKTGISKSTIGRIEKNEFSPNIQKLMQICTALEVTLVDLIKVPEDEFSEDVIELINLTKKLSENERQKVLEMLKAFIHEKEKIKINNNTAK